MGRADSAQLSVPGWALALEPEGAEMSNERGVWLCPWCRI